MQLLNFWPSPVSPLRFTNFLARQADAGKAIFLKRTKVQLFQICIAESSWPIIKFKGFIHSKMEPRSVSRVANPRLSFSRQQFQRTIKSKKSKRTDPVQKLFFQSKHKDIKQSHHTRHMGMKTLSTNQFSPSKSDEYIIQTELSGCKLRSMAPW